MPKYGPPKDVEFYDFSGGVNVADSEFRLQPNELSEAENMVPDYRGSLTVRKGMTKYNDTAISAGKFIRGLTKFYWETGTDTVIASCDSKLWSVPETGASTDLGLAGSYTLNNANTFFAQYRNRMYATCYNSGFTPAMSVIADHPDATGNLLAWAWGVTTPTNAPTAATAATGTSHPNGVYKYKYTFWYGEDGGFGESNPSPSLSHTVSGGPKDVTVTVFGAGQDFATWEDAEKAGVGTVYIYRTKVDADVYYYCGEMADSTETFTDDVTDANLDLLTSPPSDNYAPDDAKYLCVHEERMFIGWTKSGDAVIGHTEHPKRICWSQAGYPDIFPNLNYVDAPSEHGEVMGLEVLNGILYVFFESAIGALRVYGEADAEFRIVSNEVGPLAPRTLIVGSDGGVPCIFYLGRDNSVYRFDGMMATAISHPIDKYLGAELDGFTKTWSSLTIACAVFDGTDYILHPNLDVAADATGSYPRSNIWFRYNTKVRTRDASTGLSRGTWWVQKYRAASAGQALYPSVYERLDGGSDGGEVLVGAYHPTGGHIYTIDSGYSDYAYYTATGIATVPIHFTFSTGRMNLGLAGHQKAPRKLLMDKESADDITIKWEGGVEGTPTQSFTSEADTVRTKHNFEGYQPAYSFKYTLSGTSTDDDSLPTIHGFVQRFTILRED